QLGATRQDADAEYNLYKEATDRHNSLIKAHPTVKSSPSGWYELLRFGRNIGRSETDKDSLPDDAAHWRKIRTLEGKSVWADLNAPGTYKFSDADFLPRFGWNCYDDDTNPNDQRCDSERLKALIRAEGDQPNPDRNKDDVELSRRLPDNNVRKALRRAICQFPTEWDRGTIIARYGCLNEMEFGAKNRADRWVRFENHARAVSFDGLPQEYKDAQWHFHPTEFIKHFRKCGWLSLDELAQTYPRYPHYVPNKDKKITEVLQSKIFTISKEMARARFEKYQIELNRCLRKYCINTPLRISHFLSQCMTETAQWRDLPGKPIMHEWGFGKFNEGNKSTKHYAAFYGRGIMQLTWASNYREYGKFKNLPPHHDSYTERLMPIPRLNKQSMHVISPPERNEEPQMMLWSPRYDPDIIASNTHLACDSGGFYWVSKHYSGVININKKCDAGSDINVVHYINRYVNGGENAYQDRQAYFKYIYLELSDKFNETKDFLLQTHKGIINVNFDKPE
ncbi:putative chitinase, partial [Herbaspirillum sp. Sphag1AN]|nr:putative chitinase [Herbaspirillum sp. Sphag1AN]